MYICLGKEYRESWFTRRNVKRNYRNVFGGRPLNGMGAMCILAFNAT